MTRQELESFIIDAFDSCDRAGQEAMFVSLVELCSTDSLEAIKKDINTEDGV